MSNDKGNKSIWASGLILGTLAAICTGLVAVTHHVTTIKIAANEQEYLEQSLAPVLAGISYTSDLTNSTLVLQPPHDLPGNGPATIYRVYSGEDPVAALFVVTARDGFTGPIKLLIGVDTTLTISSVRILEHRETPGLGDLIEPSKSDWLKQLEKASLDTPARQNWMIKRDGGVFNQLTGASITPRAVLKAVKETLLYFEASQEYVFSTVESPQQESPE